MFDRLEGVILREMERGQVPGLAIALVKGDEIMWSRGFGVADVESKTPMTPETAPGIGEMQLFLRLIAAGGKLQGPIYARGWFGEIAMASELNRG